MPADREAAEIDGLALLGERAAQIEAAWRAREDVPHKSAPALRRLRDSVGSEQAWRCCYCGTRTTETADPEHAPTLEHIVPRSRGGSDHHANLVMACLWCNRTRGSMPAGEFFLIIRGVLA